MTFGFMSRVVNRVQRHQCTEAYCLRRPKPAVWSAIQRDHPDIARRVLADSACPTGENSKMCRFWFPKALRHSPALVGRPGTTYYAFEGARNDDRLNQFNRIVILGWLANIDFVPCTSESAVIHYMVNIVLKPRPGLMRIRSSVLR
jgi:ATP-dependent DNA helicase PIF1